MKITPDKKAGQNFKPFELEINPITWKQRCKLNDMMIKESTAGSVPNFSFWGSVVLECTDLGEDDLNKYSTDEIIAIANAIFEVANKKK